MNKIRVGVIGTGFGARVHVPIMKLHPGFEVISIASVHRNDLFKTKEQTGISHVYDNWEIMLQEQDLDLVSITSAPYLHSEMAIEVFNKKIHVLCEKPLALNSEQSRNMVTKKNEVGCLGFTNFEFRFLPARMKIKEIISGGTLGDILHVHYKGNYNAISKYNKTTLGWLGNKELGGGVLGAIGSHMIDSLLWWLEDEITEVNGQVSIHVPNAKVNGELEVRTAEDTFHMMGRFKKGTTITTELITANLDKTQWLLEIFGTKGSLIMRNDKYIELSIDGEPLSEVTLEKTLEVPNHISPHLSFFYSSFYTMLDQIYDSIKENKYQKNTPLIEDGHKVQIVLDTIRSSSALNQKIII